MLITGSGETTLDAIIDALDGAESEGYNREHVELVRTKAPAHEDNLYYADVDTGD